MTRSTAAAALAAIFAEPNALASFITVQAVRTADSGLLSAAS